MVADSRPSAVYTKVRDETLLYICFLLHSTSASEILTKYNYHLGTSTIFLCTSVHIPLLIPNFKQARFQWNFFFCIYFRIDLSFMKLFFLLFSHPYHFIKFDCVFFPVDNFIFLLWQFEKCVWPVTLSNVDLIVQIFTLHNVIICDYFIALPLFMTFYKILLVVRVLFCVHFGAIWVQCVFF